MRNEFKESEKIGPRTKTKLNTSSLEVKFTPPPPQLKLIVVKIIVQKVCLLFHRGTFEVWSWNKMEGTLDFSTINVAREELRKKRP